MKGFTKGKGKGKKFIPTSRKKSALSKNDCVSRKIPKLRHEGKSQKQSIVIAESICSRKKQTLDNQNIEEIWDNANDEKRERLLKNAYADLDFPSKIEDHPSPNLTQRDQLDSIIMMHSKTDWAKMSPMVKKRLENLVSWKREKKTLDDSKPSWAERKVKEFTDYVNSQYPNVPKEQGVMGVRESRQEYVTELASKYQFETPLNADEKKYIVQQEEREAKGLPEEEYVYPDYEESMRLNGLKQNDEGNWYMPSDESRSKQSLDEEPKKIRVTESDVRNFWNSLDPMQRLDTLEYSQNGIHGSDMAHSVTSKDFEDLPPSIQGRIKRKAGWLLRDHLQDPDYNRETGQFE